MDEILEKIVKAAKTAAGWVDFDMAVWFIALGILFVLLYIYRFILIERESKTDSTMMRELAAFQESAKDLSAEDKIDGLVSLCNRRKNSISWVYYKYFLSHIDFSEINNIFTVDEYRKVTGRMRFHVFSWLLLLATVCVGIINFCSQFDFNYIEIKNSIFDIKGINALLFFAILLVAFALHAVLLNLRRNKAIAYKTKLLNEMAATAPEFFASLEPHYQDLLVSSEKIYIPQNRRKRIKAQIIKQSLVHKKKSELKEKETKKKKNNQEDQAPNVKEVNEQQKEQGIDAKKEKLGNHSRIKNAEKPRPQEAVLTDTGTIDESETISNTQIKQNEKEVKMIKEIETEVNEHQEQPELLYYTEEDDDNGLTESDAKKEIYGNHDISQNAEIFEPQAQYVTDVTRAPVINETATMSVTELLPRPKNKKITKESSDADSISSDKSNEVPVAESSKGEIDSMPVIEQNQSGADDIVVDEQIQDKANEVHAAESNKDKVEAMVVSSDKNGEPEQERINNKTDIEPVQKVTDTQAENINVPKQINATVENKNDGISAVEPVQAKSDEVSALNSKQDETKAESNEDKTEAMPVAEQSKNKADDTVAVQPVQDKIDEVPVIESNKEQIKEMPAVEQNQNKIDDTSVAEAVQNKEAIAPAVIEEKESLKESVQTTKRIKKDVAPVLSEKYSEMHGHVSGILKRIKEELKEAKRIKAEQARAERAQRSKRKTRQNEFDADDQFEITSEQFEVSSDQPEDESIVIVEKNVRRKSGKRPVSSAGGVMRGIDKKPVKK